MKPALGLLILILFNMNALGEAHQFGREKKSRTVESTELPDNKKVTYVERITQAAEETLSDAQLEKSWSKNGVVSPKELLGLSVLATKFPNAYKKILNRNKDNERLIAFLKRQPAGEFLPHDADVKALTAIATLRALSDRDPLVADAWRALKESAFRETMKKRLENPFVPPARIYPTEVPDER